MDDLNIDIIHDDDLNKTVGRSREQPRESVSFCVPSLWWELCGGTRRGGGGRLVSRETDMFMG